ncbi:MAG: hypothetical protein AAFR52_01985, partial [Pseudomonadota bacterium]
MLNRLITTRQGAGADGRDDETTAPGAVEATRAAPESASPQPAPGRKPRRRGNRSALKARPERRGLARFLPRLPAWDLIIDLGGTPRHVRVGAPVMIGVVGGLLLIGAAAFRGGDGEVPGPVAAVDAVPVPAAAGEAVATAPTAPAATGQIALPTSIAAATGVPAPAAGGQPAGAAAPAPAAAPAASQPSTAPALPAPVLRSTLGTAETRNQTPTEGGTAEPVAQGALVRIDVPSSASAPSPAPATAPASATVTADAGTVAPSLAAAPGGDASSGPVVRNQASRSAEEAEREILRLEVEAEADRQRLRDLRRQIGLLNERYQEALGEIETADQTIASLRTRVEEQRDEIRTLRSALATAIQAPPVAPEAKPEPEPEPVAAAEPAVEDPAPAALADAGAAPVEPPATGEPALPEPAPALAGSAGGFAGPVAPQPPLALASLAPDSFARPTARIAPDVMAGPSPGGQLGAPGVGAVVASTTAPASALASPVPAAQPTGGIAPAPAAPASRPAP